jgi:dTDP-4-dehydrorhamnose 3,5-epimerase
MKTITTPLAGVVLLEPETFADRRGFLFELWSAARWEEAGIAARFIQDNVSVSRRGVLRGLHLQHPDAQGKLVTALAGRIFDVAVDLRRGSPGFGKWVGYELSAEERRQLWVPEGFAHGFCVLSETATVLYKLTGRYNPRAELSVRWDDPDLGIAWPLATPLVSEKDGAAPRLRDLDPARLPELGDGSPDGGAGGARRDGRASCRDQGGPA